MNFLVVLLPFLGDILIQLVGYIPVFILVSRVKNPAASYGALEGNTLQV